MWKYRTRPHERDSRVIIVKIETFHESELAYHIVIEGLQIKNPYLDTGIQTELPHSPVSRKTLDDSLTELEGMRHDVPDISEGYANWSEAREEQGAGIFSIPVSSIVQYIEDIVGGQTQ